MKDEIEVVNLAGEVMALRQQLAELRADFLELRRCIANGNAQEHAAAFYRSYIPKEIQVPNAAELLQANA